MRAWLIVLLLATMAHAEPQFRTHVSYPFGDLQATLLNFEQPREKPYLIVHFEIRNPSREDVRCPWSELVRLSRQDGTFMSSNYDALVDLGGGLTRTSGPFLVPRNSKVRASILFILGPGDLPGQLQLPDDRRSVTITARGRTPRQR